MFSLTRTAFLTFFALEYMTWLIVNIVQTTRSLERNYWVNNEKCRNDKINF